MFWSIANERSRAAAALLTVVAGSAVFANAARASGGPPEPASCRFSAFVEETDPAGLNVRAAPSSTSPVLGTLPPVWSDGTGWQVRIRVTVTAASNGWFRIRDAADDEALTGQPARPVYNGEGWVSGRKLVVKSQASAGRTRPSKDAAASVRFKDELLFDSDGAIEAGRPVDCRGAWVQIDYEEARFPVDLRPLLQVSPSARVGLPKGRFRAWLDEICGIQETSCDGPSSLDTP
ncbi:hypothetical protein CDL60_23575 [Roseateles noduli]|nr:hypothetical protein CDL60_23575 [Roseateles noduli]